MKKIRGIFGGLLVLTGLIGLLSLLHAQETTTSIDTGSVIPVDGTVLSLTPADIESFSSLSEAQLAAVVGALNAIPTLPMTSLPGNGEFGNFYSLQNPEWPPLPGDIHGSDCWPLSNGRYLLNDLNVNYQAPLHSRMTSLASGSMSAMDSLDPGSGSGTNTDYTPAGFTYTPPDYGTNLWISQVSVAAGYLNAVASNTVADVSYEIQTNSDLTTTNWVTTGLFFPGSEITNWTPFSLAQGNETNLFYRLRSWASSDGSGLPDWWELEYGVTDPYGDPMGDGWSNLQKFQNGWNPNLFYTPAAPQGLTAYLQMSNATALVSWLPSPGAVTNYLVTRTDDYYGQTTYNFPPSTTSFSDDVYNLQHDIIQGGTETVFADYQVVAQYPGGNSAPATVALEPDQASDITLISGKIGSAYLAATALPPGTTTLRIIREDSAAEYNDGDYSLNTNFDIPVSSSTNGLYLIPAEWLSSPVDAYGNAPFYTWWLQPVNASGGGTSAAIREGNSTDNLPVLACLGLPFLDGRVQLKQNLVFQLREALADRPAKFFYYGVDHFNYPSSYAYAGLYHMQYTGVPAYALDAFLPFEENYIFRNFVFTNASGYIDTGISDWDYYSTTNYFVLAAPPDSPSFVFTNFETGWTNLPGLLGNGDTWLCAIPMDNGFGTLPQLFYEGGLSWSSGSETLTMASNARNLFGLPFLSTKVAYSGNSGLDTINAGDSITYSAQPSFYFYTRTAQPGFQTVEYDFINSALNVLPGNPNFATTDATQPLIMSSGAPMLVSGYAKLAVTNGYSGVYGYLGQYFDQAFQIDTNGVVTTNTTGVLSSYGNFFATQPGPAALVTMPDIDTGERGTCTVYAVSLQLDANHDGNMDLSFSGPDTTSQANPFVFWLNNNYDRWLYDSDDATNYMDGLDSIEIANSVSSDERVPDCHYGEYYGTRMIPTTRDLEDFARLWVCGITTNLLTSLPPNSTITLNWGDVGNPDPNNPTIDVFAAADPDGGIGYLTNSTIAANQINSSMSPFIQRLAPGGSIQLNANFFGNIWRGNYFIWCGVASGSGQLNLTIADGNGNVLAQSSVWIQLKDIKQMYERWTVGENLQNPPFTVAVKASNDLPTNPAVTPFEYAAPQNTNTPYILFVHGWNMRTDDKDHFAETAFKRLYWQGYQGRFGSFRWPTGNGFQSWATIATSPTEKDNYDSSEFNAWLSGMGLLNKLNDLNAEYPGHVYMLAHSMGNVVAGEALRLAGTNQVVNTYVASQAAISAHTYDPSIANYSFNYPPWSSAADTPNIYGNWFADNYGGGAGQVINLYNTNDFALQRSVWQLDQLLKPDQYVRESGSTWNYGYNGSVSDPAPWNKFYRQLINGMGTVNFDIVNVITNRYEVMGYAAQSWTTALGATPGILNNVFQNIDLTRASNPIWPSDPAGKNWTEHFWHSAQFRSDNPMMQGYWSELLGSDAFKLK